VNPPHYFVLALVAMALLAQIPGQAHLPWPWPLLGFVPLAAGLALAMVAARRFSAAGTNIVPLTRSSALVTDGPFTFTRNPMYLGMTLALIGVAALVGRAWPWLVLPIFVAILQMRFIRHEERLMTETFGDAYRAYRARTRRWI
jgi:protein-S-isoprenylcysteine O-methyltransferase Ste14